MGSGAALAVSADGRPGAVRGGAALGPDPSPCGAEAALWGSSVPERTPRSFPDPSGAGFLLQRLTPRSLPGRCRYPRPHGFVSGFGGLWVIVSKPVTKEGPQETQALLEVFV